MCWGPYTVVLIGQAELDYIPLDLEALQRKLQSLTC